MFRAKVCLFCILARPTADVLFFLSGLAKKTSKNYSPPPTPTPSPSKMLKAKVLAVRASPDGDTPPPSTPSMKGVEKPVSPDSADSSSTQTLREGQKAVDSDDDSVPHAVSTSDRPSSPFDREPSISDQGSPPPTQISKEGKATVVAPSLDPVDDSPPPPSPKKTRSKRRSSVSEWDSPPPALSSLRTGKGKAKEVSTPKEPDCDSDSCSEAVSLALAVANSKLPASDAPVPDVELTDEVLISALYHGLPPP